MEAEQVLRVLGEELKPYISQGGEACIDGLYDASQRICDLINNESVYFYRKCKAAIFIGEKMNIDDNNPYTAILLFSSIDYADVDTYISNPRSKEDNIMNEIFYIKASSYFRRKINAKYPERIKIIEDDEHRQIHLLRSKLI